MSFAVDSGMCMSLINEVFLTYVGCQMRSCFLFKVTDVISYKKSDDGFQKHCLVMYLFKEQCSQSLFGRIPLHSTVTLQRAVWCHIITFCEHYSPDGYFVVFLNEGILPEIVEEHFITCSFAISCALINHFGPIQCELMHP